MIAKELNKEDFIIQGGKFFLAFNANNPKEGNLCQIIRSEGFEQQAKFMILMIVENRIVNLTYSMNAENILWFMATNEDWIFRPFNDPTVWIKWGN